MQPSNIIMMVTKERKQALLLEAIRERRNWIYSSSPFRPIKNISNTLESINHDLHHNETKKQMDLFPTISIFSSSKVSQHLPDALKVLEVLYYGVDINKSIQKGNGLEEELFPRLRLVDMERHLFHQWKHGTQDTSSSSSSSSSLLDMIPYNAFSDICDKDISNNYHQLLKKLESPEYSTIVQEIRQFVDGLDQMITKLCKDILQRKINKDESSFSDTTSSSIGYHVSIHDVPNVTLTLSKFLQYIIQDRLNHQVDWSKEDSTHNNNMSSSSSSWHSMKECMIESFIYSKCYLSIEPLLPSNRVQEDLQLKEKIQCLHTFVKPQHLDLYYFTSSMMEDNKSTTTTTNTTTTNQQQELENNILLTEPIHLIHVLEHLIAPSMILSYILKIFKSICKILDHIIGTDNEGRSTTTTITTTTTASITITNNMPHKEINNVEPINMSSSKSVLPGADDIFPTLIWTLICAQPSHLISTMLLVDTFTYSQDDEIRGELGYAYTTFKSAIQFIRDLNLDLKVEDSFAHPVHGLSISHAELQQGLNLYNLKCSRIVDINDHVQKHRNSAVVDHNLLLFNTIHKSVEELSVTKVREAKLKGECINLDWALKKHAVECLDPIENISQKPSCDPNEGTDSILDTFPRLYPFLHVESKDIRMSDVPLLLKEYQSLVQVVESLYSERSRELHTKRKNEIQTKREALAMELLDATEMMSRISSL